MFLILMIKVKSLKLLKNLNNYIKVLEKFK